MAHFLKNTKKQLVLHYHVSAGLNLHNYEYRMRVCNFRFMGKLFCLRLNEKTIVGTLLQLKQIFYEPLQSCKKLPVLGNKKWANHSRLSCTI